MTLRRYLALAVALVAPYALTLVLGFDDGVAVLAGGEPNAQSATLGILFVAVRLLTAAIVPSVLFGLAAVHTLERVKTRVHSFHVKSHSPLSLPP